jgi:hypothetical protein
MLSSLLKNGDIDLTKYINNIVKLLEITSKAKKNNKSKHDIDSESDEELTNDII